MSFLTPRNRAAVWFPIIAGMILLPFAIAWPLDGLEDAGRGQATKIGLGQGVTGHRVKIIPEKAFFTTKNPVSSFGEPKPGRFVVLDLTVANVSTMPMELTSLYLVLDVKLDGHRLDPIADLNDQQILRDDNDGAMLNPKMPEKVRISWEVPDGLGQPERLAAAMHDELYEPSWSVLGYSSGTSLWYKQEEVMATFETQLDRV